MGPHRARHLAEHRHAPRRDDARRFSRSGRAAPVALPPAAAAADAYFEAGFTVALEDVVAGLLPTSTGTRIVADAARPPRVETVADWLQGAGFVDVAAGRHVRNERLSKSRSAGGGWRLSAATRFSVATRWRTR
jgi:hypothetical protein